eukprot:m51a1_g4957 putative pas domain-containing protein tyrosine kinase (356) ;mRNA; r:348690-349876
MTGLFILGLILAIFAYSKRTLSFLNIRRPELEINEQVGKGKFGKLHRGDWHGTTVAIRVIDKKEITKTELTTIKEVIALMHKLRHPNLLMLMGYCELKTELWVVCEFMPGGSLRDFLAKNRGQLGVYSLIAIAFDVVKGIAYLHAANPPVVHGSISTRNLLIDDKMTTKVSDFWYSGTFVAKDTPTSLQPHLERKEEEWTAPEVASGSVLTTATDVWALGVVLWELFQTKRSLNKSSSSSVQMNQMAQHPEPDASMPREVVELLYQCWEAVPDQRPTIFQVLHRWPSTFASLGQFELLHGLSAEQDQGRDSGDLGPEAVVPVAMMSHCDRDTAQSFHFEFQRPGDRKSRAVVSSP